MNALLSGEAKTSTVVTRAPTSVTNITGFLIMVTGLSFLKASPMAGTMIFGSKMERVDAGIMRRSAKVEVVGGE